MDRRKELMELYISEGMMLEDLIEMVVSLEGKVEELELRLSEVTKGE